MAFKVKAPIGETFFLDNTDKYFGLEDGEDRTTVVIREATQADDRRRSTLYDEIERIYKLNDPNTIRVQQKVSPDALLEMGIYLTLSDTNITDESGSCIFKFKKDGSATRIDMTFVDFQKAIGYVPGHVVDEIYECVIKKNPDWGPDSAKKN